MAIIADEGLTADYQGEQRDKVNEDFQYDGWTPTRFNIFAPAWNTDQVSGDLIPTSWEDLADPKYDGILSVEVSDFDWYMALYGYFQDQGMDDEEIDQSGPTSSAAPRSPRATPARSSCCRPVSSASSPRRYSYLTEKARATGAPVDDQPFIEPVVARANGGGPLRAAEHPAAAMLFMDWYLEDGQALILENGLTPSVMPDGSDPLEGLEVVPVDVDQLLAEGQEWSDRYDELRPERRDPPGGLIA